jgi:manganese oxidase
VGELLPDVLAEVVDRAVTAGADGPSSIMWMYHSHVDEPRDTDAGLIGPIVVSRRGMAKADATPKGVDRELVTMLSVLDENQSWYLEENARRFAGGPPPKRETRTIRRSWSRT